MSEKEKKRRTIRRSLAKSKLRRAQPRGEPALYRTDEANKFKKNRGKDAEFQQGGKN